jgi:hypothetical protein
MGKTTLDLWSGVQPRAHVYSEFVPFALCIGFLSAPVHAVARDAEPHAYESIPARNIFGLKPVEQVQVTNQPRVLPRLILTGITTILGNKRVLMKEVPTGGTAGATNKEESLILTEGQREGPVEVLAIDEKSGSVRVNNSGTEMTLTFEKDGVKLASTPPAAPMPLPPAALPSAASPPLPGTADSTMRHFPGRIPRGTLPGQAPEAASGFGAGAVAPQPGAALPPTGGGPNPPAAATPSLDGFTPEEQQIILQLQREAATHDTGIPPQLAPAPGTPAAGTQTVMPPGFKSPSTIAPQPTLQRPQ